MSFSSTRSERGHKSYFASVSLIILFCFICCFLVSTGRFAGIAFGVLSYTAHWTSVFPSLGLLEYCTLQLSRNGGVGGRLWYPIVETCNVEAAKHWS